MKRAYEKPCMNSKAYAQFESVFTYCDKGSNKKSCSYEAPGAPNKEGKCCPAHRYNIFFQHSAHTDPVGS